VTKWIVEYRHTKWAEVVVEAETELEANTRAYDLITGVEFVDKLLDEGWEITRSELASSHLPCVK
jgi:hypothetical protein